MRGKKRHRAVSMDPIAMSDFLKQQARAAGAPPDPTAFLTLDGGGPTKAAPAPQVSRLFCIGYEMTLPHRPGTLKRRPSTLYCRQEGRLQCQQLACLLLAWEEVLDG